VKFVTSVIYNKVAKLTNRDRVTCDHYEHMFIICAHYELTVSSRGEKRPQGYHFIINEPSPLRQ